MKFSLTTFLFTILSLFSIVSALPVVRRDVFVPPLITPAEGAVWKIGSTQTVTWDASNPPAQITNPQGTLYFRKDELIQLDNPLATGFDILLGRLNVVVPEITPGVYQLVLLGDSGNDGPSFTVVA
ncbi:hypothetical protein BDQ12DRAFT_650706 [Crucibulum laeve]|uniref:Ser-Thr-rich glycosyl-phosphatidyl-inositol-anchored membrane family-domain-containing protein n=1 Tax=Crucibulum laeve TaxID=68775 RepID=A0A5C3M2J9_9AGAR|nr:hypothetical protein BDQ12DRAFT_650706 [Crucibulum laeve]